MQERKSKPQEVTVCKNHPEVPSGYFLTDQPWIKYCKNCALNVALCGRKIEKQLSPQEFDRKMQISSVVSEMKSNLEQIQSSSDYYKQLADILEEVAAPLNDHIKDIDNALRELANAKEKLESLFIQEVSEKVHYFFEKQSKITFLSIQVKKELEIIQSNYGNLIQMNEKGQFNTVKDRWNSMLSNYRNQLFYEQEFSECKVKIGKTIEEFYNQLDVISRFSIDLKLERCFQKSITNNDEFDITLTPVEGNSLRNSMNFDSDKSNMKPRTLLKLKTNKKVATQRDSLNTTKMNTRRNQFYGMENQHHTTARR